MTNRWSIKGCYQFYRKMRFEKLLKQADLCIRANHFAMPEKCRKGVIRQYQRLIQLLSREYHQEYVAAMKEGTVKKITRPYLSAGNDDEKPEIAENTGEDLSSPLEKKALSSVTIAVVLTPEYA